MFVILLGLIIVSVFDVSESSQANVLAILFVIENTLVRGLYRVVRRLVRVLR